MSTHEANLIQAIECRRKYKQTSAGRVTGDVPDSWGTSFETAQQLCKWAEDAIRGRVYGPGREPLRHWRFNVIDRPGMVVVLTPCYERFEDALRRSVEVSLDAYAANPTLRRRTREELEKEERQWHAEYDGDGNFVFYFSFLLRVIDAQAHTSHHGYFDASYPNDDVIVFLPSRDLSQAVLDTLYAASRGDPRAYAGATHCAFCQRGLTDTLSSARGYGPDCAKKFGLPWLRIVK